MWGRSFSLLISEIRGGAWRRAGLALILALGFLGSVDMLGARLQSLLDQQANRFLGADRIVQSTHDFPGQWLEQARSFAVSTSRVIEFPSVIRHTDQWQLSAVKATSSNYPLYGEIQLRTDAGLRNLQAAPNPGEVWLDPRLVNTLGVKLGEFIELGQIRLMVSGIILSEPDRGMNFINLSPRLLIHHTDLERTGLLVQGSRVRYRLLLAGDEDQLQDYTSWLETRLRPQDKLINPQEDRPALQAAMQRAEDFLRLTALMVSVLCGIAIGLGIRRYCNREMTAVAVLRTCGTTLPALTRLYWGKLAGFIVIASVAGLVLAWLAQWLVSQSLSDQFGQLPASGWLPVMRLFMASLLLTIALAWPQLYSLLRTPPRVALGSPAPLPRAPWWTWLAALLCLPALAMLYDIGWENLLRFLAGASAVFLLLWLISSVVLSLLKRIQIHLPPSLHYSASFLTWRPLQRGLWVAGIGLAFLTLVTLAYLRSGLWQDWQQKLPPSAPNHFLINIQMHQVDGIKQLFTQQGLDAPEFYPMVRGRLLAINDAEINAQSYDTPRAQRLATREFNLSWDDVIGENNALVAGQWWGPVDKGKTRFSVEQGIARTLGIELGDTLRYAIGGEIISGPVVSLRKVEWQTMRPNFFVLLPPDSLNHVPATYLCSFYLPAERQGLLNQLLGQFPNVTIFDVKALLGQAREFTNRVLDMVEFLFFFCLGIGLILLSGLIEMDLDTRQRSTALLHAIGISRNQLRRAYFYEFLGLGTLIGLVVSLAGFAFAASLSVNVMKMDFSLPNQYWFMAFAAVALFLALAGIILARSILKVSPVKVLQAQE